MRIRLKRTIIVVFES